MITSSVEVIRVYGLFRLKLDASGRPRLHVAQHRLKPLHVGRVSVGQVVRQPTVETERLQLQPDETETVLVEQHKEPRRALWTREAVPSDQTRSIEAETQTTRQVSSCCSARRAMGWEPKNLHILNNKGTNKNDLKDFLKSILNGQSSKAIRVLTISCRCEGTLHCEP